MTVSSETSRKSFVGDGATTSFGTSPMVFFDTADLLVYVVTTATGAATLLTENTHYTVSGGDGSTGTVSTAGGSSPYGAPSASQTLLIVRDVAITQGSDLINNDGSDAEVLEDALDRLTMIAQQHATLLDRSFTLPDSDVSGASTELPTPAASQLIGWNDTADALQNYSTADLDIALTTAFTLTLLDDADADAFLETLVDAMTAETAPATGDLIPISDVSANDGRKMTLENLLKVVDGLTEDTTPDLDADFLLSYDTSGSAAKKVKLGRAAGPVNGTAQATTSGTAKDFTIPSWATRIVLSFAGISTAAGTADPIVVQLGDAGGIETSGYNGSLAAFSNGGAVVTLAHTTGFHLASQDTAISHGTITLTLLDAATNTWVATGMTGRSDAAVNTLIGGSKALSAALTTVRLTTTDGTEAFDAGSVNVQYE